MAWTFVERGNVRSLKGVMWVAKTLEDRVLWARLKTDFLPCRSSDINPDVLQIGAAAILPRPVFAKYPVWISDGWQAVLFISLSDERQDIRTLPIRYRSFRTYDSWSLLHLILLLRLILSRYRVLIIGHCRPIIVAWITGWMWLTMWFRAVLSCLRCYDRICSWENNRENGTHLRSEPNTY